MPAQCEICMYCLNCFLCCLFFFPGCCLLLYLYLVFTCTYDTCTCTRTWLSLYPSAKYSVWLHVGKSCRKYTATKIHHHLMNIEKYESFCTKNIFKFFIQSAEAQPSRWTLVQQKSLGFCMTCSVALPGQLTLCEECIAKRDESVDKACFICTSFFEKER